MKTVEDIAGENGVALRERESGLELLIMTMT